MAIRDRAAYTHTYIHTCISIYTYTYLCRYIPSEQSASDRQPAHASASGAILGRSSDGWFAPAPPLVTGSVMVPSATMARQAVSMAPAVRPRAESTASSTARSKGLPKAKAGREPVGGAVLCVCFLLQKRVAFLNIPHNIRLTPHTLSAERNRAKRRSAGWPEDQRLHLGRRTWPPSVSFSLGEAHNRIQYIYICIYKYKYMYMYVYIYVYI